MLCDVFPFGCYCGRCCYYCCFLHFFKFVSRFKFYAFVLFSVDSSCEFIIIWIWILYYLNCCTSSSLHRRCKIGLTRKEIGVHCTHISVRLWWINVLYFLTLLFNFNFAVVFFAYRALSLAHLLCDGICL